MPERVSRIADWLLVASLVLSLSAYAYLGSYSRYMADDYSAVSTVRTHGLLGAQIASYKGWTGRFSFTFVADLLAFIGPATPPFIPGLLLILWFAGVLWASYQIHSLLGKIFWARVVLFAGFLIFATLETAANLGQSLYWQTGTLTYIAPFIPLSLYIGVMGRGVRTAHSAFSYPLWLSCAAILTFIAGGFSDAYAVLQTCALIFATVTVEILGGGDFKSRIRPFLLAGLVGSLLALIIVVLAPGNSIRITYFQRHLGAWDMARLTTRFSLGFLAKQVLTHPLIFVATLTLPSVIVLRDFGRDPQRKWDRRLCAWLLLVTPAAVLLLSMCCIAPGVYAMSTMLPERARILLSLVFVCGTVIWSCAAGGYLAPRLLINGLSGRSVSLIWSAVMLLVIVCSQISFLSLLRTREQARSFAADWDREDAELKSAQRRGVANVTVQQIGDFQSRTGKGPSDLHLRTDPAFWINRTTATYYGLTSVRADQDLESSYSGQ